MSRVKIHHFPDFYPIGIYTIPEISSCGYTEDQLKKNSILDMGLVGLAITKLLKTRSLETIQVCLKFYDI